MIIYTTNKNINKNKIIKKLILIKEWENRYKYIMHLGNFLFKMPINLIKKNNIITSCNDYIWCDFYVKNNKLILCCHSNSLISKGLISIILLMLNRYSIKKIKKINFNILINKKLSKNIQFNLEKLLIIEIFIKDKINKLNIKL